VASWITRSVLTDEDLAQTRCTYAGTDNTGNPSGGSGDDNTLYGNATAPSLTTGSLNTGVGSICLSNLIGGSSNSAVGWSSLVQLTTGNQNAAIGNNSGLDIVTGSANTCLGHNTTVGNTAAVNRIVIGAGAVGEINNSCVIGSAALTAIHSGSDNICDLGSSTKQFKDGYFGTSVNTTLVTDGVNSITLTPTSVLPLVSDDFSNATLNNSGVLTGTLSGFPVLDIINDRVQLTSVNSVSNTGRLTYSDSSIMTAINSATEWYAKATVFFTDDDSLDGQGIFFIWSNVNTNINPWMGGYTFNYQQRQGRPWVYFNGSAIGSLAGAFTPWVVGTDYDIEVRVRHIGTSNTEITFFLDGVQIWQFIDTYRNLTRTYVGMGAYVQGSTNLSCDYFVKSIEIDVTTLNLGAGPSNIAITSNELIPSTTAVTSLGNDTNRWKDIYAGTIVSDTTTAFQDRIDSNYTYESSVQTVQVYNNASPAIIDNTSITLANEGTYRASFSANSTIQEGPNFPNLALARLNNVISILESQSITQTHALGFSNETLTGGVYYVNGACTMNNSIIFNGSSTTVWVIRITAALAFGSGCSFSLFGQARAENIFILCTGAVTTLNNLTLIGTLISKAAISIGTSANIEGRLYTPLGAITVSSSTNSVLPPNTSTLLDLEELESYQIYSGGGVLTGSGSFQIVGNIATRVGTVTGFGAPWDGTYPTSAIGPITMMVALYINELPITASIRYYQTSDLIPMAISTECNVNYASAGSVITARVQITTLQGGVVFLNRSIHANALELY
jgi:hypothetical protein